MNGRLRLQIVKLSCHESPNNECGISRQESVGGLNLHLFFGMCRSQLTWMCFTWVETKQFLLMIPWFKHVNMVPFGDNPLELWELGRRALLGHLRLPGLGMVLIEATGKLWIPMDTYNIPQASLEIGLVGVIDMWIMWTGMMWASQILDTTVHIWTLAPSHLMLRQVSICTVLSLHYLCFSDWYGSNNLLRHSMNSFSLKASLGRVAFSRKRRIRNSEYDAYISRLCVVVEILISFQAICKIDISKAIMCQTPAQ